MVESLESWAVTPSIMPNLCRFIENHNVLYATKVVSQTRGGTSSDGQMIINTGLLPLQEGAVCQRYPNNVFPSISENYTSAALIMPGDLGIWNQKQMSDAYKIDTNYLSPHSLDHETFVILDSIYNKHDYLLAITMATHSPFMFCAGYSDLELPKDMPTLLSNYIKSMNYSDACFATLLSKIDTDSILKNSVICFVGDHIIFDTNMRNEFSNYCRAKNLSYDIWNNHTTIIAYSPDFVRTEIIDSKTYQMDVYPTLLQLINCNDYYWRGFGVNLLDSMACHNRPVTEEDACMLSDKLIRANFFKKYSINEEKNCLYN